MKSLDRRHALLALGALLAGCSRLGSPAAPRPPSALPNVSVLPQRLNIPGLNRERTLRLYLPPSYALQPERRYPVIYMHDGQNLFDDATSYAGEWGVDETLNELARTHGFEAIVVGIDNGLDKRMNELNPWPHPQFGVGEGEDYVSFIVDVVKPLIDRDYRTLRDAANTAVIGSSMGGLISDYAIHRHPGVFGKAGVFSPAYWTAPEMFRFAAERPLPPGARVYLYMGGGEGEQMVSNVQRMHSQLNGTLPAGASSVLRVVPGAPHNEGAWRRELPAALVWLFELQPATAVRPAAG